MQIYLSVRIANRFVLEIRQISNNAKNSSLAGVTPTGLLLKPQAAFFYPAAGPLYLRAN